MRFCRNMVTSAEGNWLTYTFDPPDSGIEFEGVHGSGDSGGPSVIDLEGSLYLAGLSSWQYVDGDINSHHQGVYGTIAYQVRISSYLNWIDQTIAINK